MQIQVAGGDRPGGFQHGLVIPALPGLCETPEQAGHDVVAA